MKIGITGALGHIGSGLVRHLQEDFPDAQLYLYDNLQTQRYSTFSSFKPGFKFFEIDVREKSLKRHFLDLDLVFHLAATTDASGTAKSPNLIFDNNMIATENVVEIGSELGVKVVFPSTTSVYGSQTSLVDEDCEYLNPQSPYAVCKLQEEALVLKNNGLVLRLGTIHGVSPGMRFHTAVNKFCWQAAWNQPVTIWETALNQVRPYLALQDLYSAFSRIITNDESFHHGQTINLVSQNATPNEIVKEIQKTREVSISLVSDSIMNQLSYAVSNKKAIRNGFEFHNYLEMNIKKTMQYLGVEKV